ncbi:AAA family ATPase [Ancylobacter defluvii]|nr:AAA family ATPase [Ancylobacter defluvii]MBS7588269.1 AAA family ATPase [Ancylobacter defluvii]
MVDVATVIWGAPRKGATKTEIRFGEGRTVNPEKGTWFIHGASPGEGEGGGVLALIEREVKLKGKEAFSWLKDKGFHVEDRRAGAAGGGQRRDQPRDEGELGRKTVVSLWDYVDENGDLLFQTLRYQFKMPDGSWRLGKDGKVDKTYGQRRKARPEDNALDEWVYSVKGERLVPYRLPDIMEALADERPVFIVEGEKAADRLWEVGIPATTNPMGAGKWPEEFAPIFRNADLIILPDNDEPGRKHRDLVGSRLKDVAGRCRVLNLPGLPEKGDSWDWQEAGGTADALYRLVDMQARPWAPGLDPFRSRFGATTWADVFKPRKAYQWLIKGILPWREAILIYGAPQTGKSFETQNMALHIARGLPFHGRKVRKAGVVYCAFEGGKGFLNRQHAYAMEHGLGEADDINMVVLTRRADLFSSDVDCDALIEEIKHFATTFADGLGLVVLDTWSAATPGANENESGDVSKIRARVWKIMEHCQCTVLVVHHKPKNGGSPRGHGSLTGDFETTIDIDWKFAPKANPKAPEEKIYDVDKRPIRRAEVTKQREGEQGITWDFVLHQVQTGTDDDGDAITSCVVARPNEAPVEAGDPDAVKGVGTNEGEKLFLRALRRALLSSGERPDPALGLPIDVDLIVDYAKVKDEYAKLSPHDEADPKKRAEAIKKALQRARTSLTNKGVFCADNPFCWWTGKKVRGFSMNPPRPQPTEPTDDELDAEVPF